MTNVITVNLTELGKLSKVFKELCGEVTITFTDKKMEVYGISSCNTMVAYAVVQSDTPLHQTFFNLKSDNFLALFKGIKEGSKLQYNDEIIQTVTGKKAITFRVFEPNVHDTKKPNIPTTSSFIIDGKELIGGLKEAASSFPDIISAKFQHVAKELIMEVEDSGNSIVRAFDVDPIQGELCASRYAIDRLLKILPEGQVCLSMGDSLPIVVEKKQNGFNYKAILAPRVDNV